MRAVVIREHGAIDAQRIEEVRCRPPGQNELLVEIRAASLNFPDLLVIRGTYQNLPARPFTPGKDGAGMVKAVGPGVIDFAVGDRVLVHLEYGAFAEEAICKAANCHPMPDAMTFVQAAAMGLVYQTAYFALVVRGRLEPGERILITGARGGVGLAAVQLAKALGGQVIAGVRGPDCEGFLREHGADGVIDLAASDLRESMREQVRRHADGRLVNLAIDTVGGEVFSGALRCLDWEGRLIVVGFAAGSIPEVKANYLLVKNIAVAGLQWSDYRDRTPDAVRDVQERLFELFRRGLIKPTVTQTFPLDRFRDALQQLESGVLGKIVVTIDG